MADLLPLIETLENSWMRAWIGGDVRILKGLTSRNFRLVIGSKPSVLLDAKSWLDAAPARFRCRAYRFGEIYVRNLGSVTIFATQMEIEASIDGHDWSGRMWVTDLWKKSGVRRSWRMVERVFSRPEGDEQVPAAIRSLQLWRRPAKRQAFAKADG
jgi:hypothetical protein